MGMSLKKGKGVTPDINVTPLVDVVLVLLIIFMVVIPNTQDGKPIEMVKVQDAEDLEDEDTWVITIDRNETITLGTDDLPRERVLNTLRKALEASAAKPVLLRGDGALSYKVMRGLFKDIQDIGYQKIHLAVGVGQKWSPEEEG